MAPLLTPFDGDAEGSFGGIDVGAGVALGRSVVAVDGDFDLCTLGPLGMPASDRLWRFLLPFGLPLRRTAACAADPAFAGDP